MNKTAQVIMRSYGDRIGRNRLNCDSTLKVSKPPRGNAILTGESTPDISESGTARYLIIELQKNDINIDMLTKMQELARTGTWKAIMSLYIKQIYFYVNDTYSEKTFGENLRGNFQNFRAIIQNELNNREINVHSRIPEAIAWL